MSKKASLPIQQGRGAPIMPLGKDPSPAIQAAALKAAGQKPPAKK